MNDAHVELAYRIDGGPQAPVVFLAPSLGTTWEMWDGLAEELTSTYRVVRLDTRGHGRSPVPPGPYTVDALADDVLALADSLGVVRFGFVGLSLGGAIGQSLCVRYDGRLAAAVLCCTVPRFGDPSTWRDRAATVRAEGMAGLAPATEERWFTEAFRLRHRDEVDRLIGMLTATDPEGYAACCEALAGFDVTDELAGINVPVRVVGGDADPVAPPEACEAMASAIPGADLVVVPDASHLANVAQPAAFDRAVVEHLERNL